MSEIFRTCKTCQTPKPFNAFPTYISRHNGKSVTKPVCDDCIKFRDREYRRKRYEADPEYKQKLLDTNKSYREKYSDGYKLHQIRKRLKSTSLYNTDLKTRVKSMVNASKTRALAKGFEFELSLDIVMAFIYATNFKCAVTGVPFDLKSNGAYHKNPYAPSLDRKDSNKGYTIDNIQIVCIWYNMMKNEWSDKDVKNFVAIAYKTMFESDVNG